MDECGHGLAEEHHAETRIQQIVAGGKRDPGGVGFAKREMRVNTLRRARPDDLQHRLRHIDTQHRACRADAAGERDRRVAATASDVDHAFSRLRRGGLQRGVAEGMTMPSRWRCKRAHCWPTAPFQSAICCALSAVMLHS